MTMSPFFRTLGSAYQAEIDDLTFDSDGKDVLRQRLADKRKELGFLCQMIELSPEMVAVVFHQGFQFKRPSAMEDLVAQGGNALPEWSSLGDAVLLSPWAQDLAKVMLKEPKGGWLMTVAAGLEYLYGKPGKPMADDGADDGDTDEDREDQDGQDDQDDRDGQYGDGYEDQGEGNARSREAAGQDWLEQQGFDRKDS